MNFGDILKASHGRVGRLVGEYTPPENGSRRYVLQGDASGHPMAMQVVTASECEEIDHEMLIVELTRELCQVVRRFEYLGLKPHDIKHIFSVAWSDHPRCDPCTCGMFEDTTK